MSVSSDERLLGTLKIRPHPAGIPDVGPGSSPEILNQAGFIATGVQGLRKPEGKETQIFSIGRVAGCCLQAPLHQKLKDAPGMKPRRVLEEKLPLLGGVLDQLDVQTGRRGPFLFQQSQIAFRHVLALPDGFAVSVGIAGPTQHFRQLLGDRAGVPVAQGPDLLLTRGALDQMIHHAQRLVGQRQKELLQHEAAGMHLQRPPPCHGRGGRSTAST
ncbi:MAG TPA: hypothetical protein VLQ45_30915, partial [Thermoanaerobaculia bacterium]|nr:hypothetical protein [Thermoanaerobaculia bacterium]